LWVGGGNEIRSGAFAGQAQLAARIAASGFPVFRFDRRGVGDSEGGNPGFRHSAPDIAAALGSFRAQRPDLHRVVAFGNCDAASALMLAAGAGCQALVLSNPWTIENDEEGLAQPPAAIRQRYAAKLKQPAEWLRLLRGGVSLPKLAHGLARSVRRAPAPTSLAQTMRASLATFDGPVRILIAERDRTAQAFVAGWDKADPRLRPCPGASHAFVEPHAREWLFEQLIGALSDEEAGELHVR